MSELALLGGPAAVTSRNSEVFDWPLVTQEDEAAVLDVLRRRAMSGTDITRQFEEELANWHGRSHGLAFHNGTASLQAAMWACGVRRGDEVICPSMTYWAACLPAYSLGATIVFADIEEETLCIDPADIESRITDRTKAIIVVHYSGYPAPMDRIMAIARRYELAVIEDLSQAHGGLYRGNKVGSFGDVGAMSMMTGKSLAAGEIGAFVTNRRDAYDGAIAFGHYARFTDENIQSESLKPYIGLPLGGYKYRVNQLASAIARVQLKHYDERMAEIQSAVNHFWNRLDGVPGLRPHRPPRDSGSTMGGWYLPRAHYNPEELGGLSVTRFCEALQAEGVEAARAGTNLPLHTHPVLTSCDIYGDGKPTRVAFSQRDVRESDADLPVTNRIGHRVCAVPWFKKEVPEVIAQYADAYRKVVDHHEELLVDDPGDDNLVGGWGSFKVT